MAHRIYETTTHDFDPVNKYIDEKARLRRTKSTWRYTKALALFLIAFGLFLILAAYAYHIFKKPHDRVVVEDRIIQSEEKIKQNYVDNKHRGYNYMQVPDSNLDQIIYPMKKWVSINAKHLTNYDKETINGNLNQFKQFKILSLFRRSS